MRAQLRHHAVALLLSALLAGPAPAADAVAGGKALHERHCVDCHSAMYGARDERLYTRPQRRMENLAQLRGQVHQCARNLAITLSADQIEDVTRYLNTHYYHFGGEQP